MYKPKCELCGAGGRDYVVYFAEFTEWPRNEENDGASCAYDICYICAAQCDMLYVNVYEVGRAYGGAEEGGWWYDYGIAVASTKIIDQLRVDAENLGLHLQPYFDEGNGQEYRICVESTPAANYPSHRPYYS